MVKSFKITNHRDETLHMVLTNPWACGVAVASVEGLSPPKIDVNAVEMATLDGSIYTSSRAQARNIVFQLIMMDQVPSAQLIEDSRHLVYKYFPIKHEIMIEVETDRRTSRIWGYVESNETYIFSKQEYAQISVICPDPWFYDINDTTIVTAGIESLFEFPFSNESLEENLLLMGEYKENTAIVFPYIGDVDTGIKMTLHALGTTGDITIYDRTTQQNMFIDVGKIKTITGFQFGKGDDILISTKKGYKSVYLLHNGKRYNIIAALAKDSAWFQIVSGENIIGFSTDRGQDKLHLTICYNIAYGGA